jgi:hypothetical protein
MVKANRTAADLERARGNDPAESQTALAARRHVSNMRGLTLPVETTSQNRQKASTNSHSGIERGARKCLCSVVGCGACGYKPG